MENRKREMTREELIKELNRYIDENAKLKSCNDAYYCEKNEYQCHIKQLQSDLKEVVDRTQDYDLVIHCGSPITVVQDLIEKTSSATDLFGNEHMDYYYSKSELKQIAEHLMVYVNNTDDERE